jgi:hypothetical protein
VVQAQEDDLSIDPIGKNGERIKTKGKRKNGSNLLLWMS